MMWKGGCAYKWQNSKHVARQHDEDEGVVDPIQGKGNDYAGHWGGEAADINECEWHAKHALIEVDAFTWRVQNIEQCTSAVSMFLID